MAAPLDLVQGLQRWQPKLAFGGLDVDASAIAKASELVLVAEAETAEGLVFRASSPIGADGHFVLPIAPAGTIRVHTEDGRFEYTATVLERQTTSIELR